MSDCGYEPKFKDYLNFNCEIQFQGKRYVRTEPSHIFQDSQNKIRYLDVMSENNENLVFAWAYTRYEDEHTEENRYDESRSSVMTYKEFKDVK